MAHDHGGHGRHHHGHSHTHDHELSAFTLRCRDLARRFRQAVDLGYEVSAIDPVLEPIARLWSPPEEPTSDLIDRLGRAEALLSEVTGRPAPPPLGIAEHSLPGDMAHSPAMSGGDAGVVWLSFRDGAAERIVARNGRTTISEELPKPALRPTSVTSADGLRRVFFSMLTEAGSALFQWVPGQGDSKQLLGAHALNQSVAAGKAGEVHLACQTSAGRAYDITYLRIVDGEIAGQETVAEGGLGNCWDPDVAVAPDGSVWVVWCQYDGQSYQIMLRQRLSDGSWKPIVSVPRATGVEYALHPSIVLRSDGSLYLAYDSVVVPDHAGSGDTASKPLSWIRDMPKPNPDPRGTADGFRVGTRVEVVRFDGTSFVSLSPSDDFKFFHTRSSGTYPRLCVDGQDRLWMAYRLRRALPFRHHYFPMTVALLDGGTWVCRGIASSDGPSSEPAITAIGDGIELGWVSDGRVDRALELYGDLTCDCNGSGPEYGGYPLPDPISQHSGTVSWEANNGAGTIRGCVVTPAHMPQGQWARAAATMAALGGAMPPAVGKTRHTDIAPDHRIDVGGVTHRLYWGDLHRHSNVSRCAAGTDLELGDHFRFARDVCDYDFWAMTDHAEHCGAFHWHLTRKLANMLHVPRFHVPLVGFEWTSFDHGHMNVIYPGEDGPIFSSRDPISNDPQKLWDALDGRRALTIPHHPAAVHYSTDWDGFRNDEYVRLVEVFQAATGSYEEIGTFRGHRDTLMEGRSVRAALDRGRRLGMICSTDHRFGASYASVYAPELTREAVFQAMYDRRTFGSTTYGLIPTISVGSAVMGETVAPGQHEVTFGGLVSRDLRFARVQLIRNGHVECDIGGGAPRRVDLDITVLVPELGARKWIGAIRALEGARLVEAPYIHRNITKLTDTEADWQFALPELFGSWLRPPAAEGVSISVDVERGGSIEIRLGEHVETLPADRLLEGDLDFAVAGTRVLVRRGVGSLVPMEGQRHERGATMTLEDGDYLYTRVILENGEMAWSSPIWCQKTVS